jgi:pimeloyl-ACP methyl ester carboxylesterase
MSLDSEGLIEIPGVTSHYIRLSDGQKAHFSTAGHHGPAIILCHGGLPGSSGITFRYALPFLGANGFRVYAPDFPGFGLADTRKEYWRGGQGSPVHVDFIHRFADALCLDDFHITGNSMGCGNTLQYVLAHPERVRNFVLLAGTVGDIANRNHGVRSSMDVQALNRSTFDGSEASMRIVMQGLVQDPATIPDDVVKMRTAAANRQRESYTNAFSAPPAPERSRARTTSVGRIDRIGIPAVYAYGIDDRMSPVQNGFSDEDAVSNIQFFYPEGAGHALHNDIPEVVNQFLLEFFRDSKVSWKTAQAMGVSRRRAINPDLVEEPAGGFPAPMPEAYNDLSALKEKLASVPAGAD